MRSKVFLLLAVLAVFALAGCGGDDSSLAPPDGPVDLTGSIAEVGDDGRVLLKAGPDDDCGIWIAENDETEVLRKSGDGYEEASWSDLAEGTEADAWVAGGVAMSCPGQAKAGTIVISG